jgi:hypothetical protein
MVKGYLEYIKEHFGAITIERPPEDMFVRNPNLPQPLSINTRVGGTNRIPMHWNNSPYLSGGFGGSGYGRFGQDPEETSVQLNDSFSANINKKIEILISISDSILSFIDISGYSKVVKEMVNYVQREALSLTGAGGGELNSQLNNIEILVTSEMIDKPVPGSSGSYLEAPDPGEGGVYQTFISGTSKVADILDIKTVDDIPTIDDMVEVLSENEKLLYMIFNEYGKIGKDCFLKIKECVHIIQNHLKRMNDTYDQNYFENGSANLIIDEDFADIFDVWNYGVFIYLIKLAMCESGGNYKGHKEMPELIKSIRSTEYENISEKSNIDSVLNKVIQMPDVLKKY